MYYEKTQKERIQELEDKLLYEIEKYIKRKGYAPSVRDLKRLVGIPSTSTTFEYMKRLQRKKLIDWEPRQSRSLRLLKKKA